jgi:hypothetical protein
MKRVVSVWLLLLVLTPLLVAQVATYQRLRLGGGASGKLAEVDTSGNLLVALNGTAAQAATDPSVGTFARMRLAGGATGNLVEVDSSGQLLVSCTNCVGSGSGAGAPNTEAFWVGAPSSNLSAEKDLSALSTGLVLNTAGTPSTYAGTGACSAGQALTALSASGAPTCTAVSQTLYHTCTLIIGADNGASLVDADLGPQGRQCFIPTAGTLVEMTIAADAGTPNVIPRRNRAGTTANVVSGALATAASGGLACAKTSGVTGLDGATTCSATLQNTTLNAGDWLELTSGSASTAKRMSIALTWSIP